MPASTISNISGATSIKDPNYSNNMDFSENVKKFQAKHGSTDINEWENKNSLADKYKTNANF